MVKKRTSTDRHKSTRTSVHSCVYIHAHARCADRQTHTHTYTNTIKVKKSEKSYHCYNEKVILRSHNCYTKLRVQCKMGSGGACL